MRVLPPWPKSPSITTSSLFRFVASICLTIDPLNFNRCSLGFRWTWTSWRRSLRAPRPPTCWWERWTSWRSPSSPLCDCRPRFWSRASQRCPFPRGTTVRNWIKTFVQKMWYLITDICELLSHGTSITLGFTVVVTMVVCPQMCFSISLICNVTNLTTRQDGFNNARIKIFEKSPPQESYKKGNTFKSVYQTSRINTMRFSMKQWTLIYRKTPHCVFQWIQYVQ